MNGRAVNPVLPPYEYIPDAELHVQWQSILIRFS